MTAKRPVITRSEDHRYTLDGGNVPNVTGIIAGVFRDKQWASDWHMERGSANHACYDLLARGELEDYEIDPQCQPWIDGWCRWAADFLPEFEDVEMIVGSRRLRYSGTLDLVAKINNKRWVIDFKNSASKRDRFQLALYALAWEEMNGVKKIHGGMTVEISGNGFYRLALKLEGAEWRRALAGATAMRTVYDILGGTTP